MSAFAAVRTLMRAGGACISVRGDPVRASLGVRWLKMRGAAAARSAAVEAGERQRTVTAWPCLERAVTRARPKAEVAPARRTEWWAVEAEAEARRGEGRRRAGRRGRRAGEVSVAGMAGKRR